MAQIDHWLATRHLLPKEYPGENELVEEWKKDWTGTGLGAAQFSGSFRSWFRLDAPKCSLTVRRSLSSDSCWDRAVQDSPYEFVIRKLL